MKSSTLNTRQLIVCVALALFATGSSQAPKLADRKAADPQPGTPEAAAEGERLMRSMSDSLANSKSFTFGTSERFDVSATDGAFAVQPPVGHAPIDFSDFAAGLLSRLVPLRQQAVSFTDSGAKPVSKLNSYRGARNCQT